MKKNELKEALDYNEETGIFTWKISNNNRIKVGDKAGYTSKRNGYTQIKINRKLYAPTIALAVEVHKEITKRVGEEKSILVTSNETGAGQLVSEYLLESLTATNSDKCIVCTHEGLSSTYAAELQRIKKLNGVKLTIIIDELPSLFKSYSRRFPSDLKKQLETVISINDERIDVIDEVLYEQVIKHEFYHPDCIKLLKLRHNVRMIHDVESNEWSFFGYELADNFGDILKLADEAYLLASTITGTLDEVILKDIWSFKFEKDKEIYARINHHDLIERAKRAHIIPLLDSSYSKGKAFDRDYKAKSGKCLSTMIKTTIELIGDNEAIMVANNWAIDSIRTQLKGVSNITLLQPNVKGMNTHQAKHWCCALFTAKPTPDIHKSLKLLADMHQLENASLLEAYKLQYDLDMIVQMCGRISIRDRNATSKCTFIVPDELSAKHLVKVLTGDREHYDELVDETHMLCWDDMTESNTKIGRPLSKERESRLQELELIFIEAKVNGVKPKQNVLATMFSVKSAQISKDRKLLRENGRI